MRWCPVSVTELELVAGAPAVDVSRLSQPAGVKLSSGHLDEGHLRGRAPLAIVVGTPAGDPLVVRERARVGGASAERDVVARLRGVELPRVSVAPARD